MCVVCVYMYVYMCVVCVYMCVLCVYMCEVCVRVCSVYTCMYLYELQRKRRHSPGNLADVTFYTKELAQCEHYNNIMYVIKILLEQSSCIDSSVR